VLLNEYPRSLSNKHLENEEMPIATLVIALGVRSIAEMSRG
jgi:hypothetical protein